MVAGERPGATTTRERYPVDRYDLEIQARQRRREAIRRMPEVRKAIAQTRVAFDESLGEETPQWIRDIAEAPLPSDGR